MFYLPYAIPDMLAVEWRQVSAGAWIGTSLSALLALNLSYVLWNTAVQRIGSSQTAIYSNLIPVARGRHRRGLAARADRSMEAIGAALIVAGLVAATRFGGAPTPSRPKSSGDQSATAISCTSKTIIVAGNAGVGVAACAVGERRGNGDAADAADQHARGAHLKTRNGAVRPLPELGPSWGPG